LNYVVTGYAAQGWSEDSSIIIISGSALVTSIATPLLRSSSELQGSGTLLLKIVAARLSGSASTVARPNFSTVLVGSATVQASLNKIKQADLAGSAAVLAESNLGRELSSTFPIKTGTYEYVLAPADGQLYINSEPFDTTGLLVGVETIQTDAYWDDPWIDTVIQLYAATNTPPDDNTYLVHEDDDPGIETTENGEPYWIQERLEAYDPTMASLAHNDGSFLSAIGQYYFGVRPYSTSGFSEILPINIRVTVEQDSRTRLAGEAISNATSFTTGPTLGEGRLYGKATTAVTLRGDVLGSSILSSSAYLPDVVPIIRGYLYFDSVLSETATVNIVPTIRGYLYFNAPLTASATLDVLSFIRGLWYFTFDLSASATLDVVYTWYNYLGTSHLSQQANLFADAEAGSYREWGESILSGGATVFADAGATHFGPKLIHNLDFDNNTLDSVTGLTHNYSTGSWTYVVLPEGTAMRPTSGYARFGRTSYTFFPKYVSWSYFASIRLNASGGTMYQCYHPTGEYIYINGTLASTYVGMSMRLNGTSYNFGNIPHNGVGNTYLLEVQKILNGTQATYIIRIDGVIKASVTLTARAPASNGTAVSHPIHSSANAISIQFVQYYDQEITQSTRNGVLAKHLGATESHLSASATSHARPKAFGNLQGTATLDVEGGFYLVYGSAHLQGEAINIRAYTPFITLYPQVYRFTAKGQSIPGPKAHLVGSSSDLTVAGWRYPLPFNTDQIFDIFEDGSCLGFWPNGTIGAQGFVPIFRSANGVEGHRVGRFDQAGTLGYGSPDVAAWLTSNTLWAMSFHVSNSAWCPPIGDAENTWGSPIVIEAQHASGDSEYQGMKFELIPNSFGQASPTSQVSVVCAVTQAADYSGADTVYKLWADHIEMSPCVHPELDPTSDIPREQGFYHVTIEFENSHFKVYIDGDLTLERDTLTGSMVLMDSFEMHGGNWDSVRFFDRTLSDADRYVLKYENDHKPRAKFNAGSATVHAVPNVAICHMSGSSEIDVLSGIQAYLKSHMTCNSYFGEKYEILKINKDIQVSYDNSYKASAKNQAEFWNTNMEPRTAPQSTWGSRPRFYGNPFTQDGVAPVKEQLRYENFGMRTIVHLPNGSSGWIFGFQTISIWDYYDNGNSSAFVGTKNNELRFGFGSTGYGTATKRVNIPYTPGDSVELILSIIHGSAVWYMNGEVVLTQSGFKLQNEGSGYVPSHEDFANSIQVNFLQMNFTGFPITEVLKFREDPKWLLPEMVSSLNVHRYYVYAYGEVQTSASFVTFQAKLDETKMGYMYYDSQNWPITARYISARGGSWQSSGIQTLHRRLTTHQHIGTASWLGGEWMFGDLMWRTGRDQYFYLNRNTEPYDLSLSPSNTPSELGCPWELGGQYNLSEIPAGTLDTHLDLTRYTKFGLMQAYRSEIDDSMTVVFANALGDDTADLYVNGTFLSNVALPAIPDYVLDGNRSLVGHRMETNYEHTAIIGNYDLVDIQRITNQILTDTVLSTTAVAHLHCNSEITLHAARYGFTRFGATIQMTCKSNQFYSKFPLSEVATMDCSASSPIDASDRMIGRLSGAAKSFVRSPYRSWFSYLGQNPIYSWSFMSTDTVYDEFPNFDVPDPIEAIRGYRVGGYYVSRNKEWYMIRDSDTEAVVRLTPPGIKLDKIWATSNSLISGLTPEGVAYCTDSLAALAPVDDGHTNLVAGSLLSLYYANSSLAAVMLKNGAAICWAASTSYIPDLPSTEDWVDVKLNNFGYQTLAYGLVSLHKANGVIWYPWTNNSKLAQTVNGNDMTSAFEVDIYHYPDSEAPTTYVRTTVVVGLNLDGTLTINSDAIDFYNGLSQFTSGYVDIFVSVKPKQWPSGLTAIGLVKADGGVEFYVYNSRYDTYYGDPAAVQSSINASMPTSGVTKDNYKFSSNALSSGDALNLINFSWLDNDELNNTTCSWAFSTGVINSPVYSTPKNFLNIIYWQFSGKDNTAVLIYGTNTHVFFDRTTGVEYLPRFARAENLPGPLLAVTNYDNNIYNEASLDLVALAYTEAPTTQSARLSVSNTVLAVSSGVAGYRKAGKVNALIPEIVGDSITRPMQESTNIRNFIKRLDWNHPNLSYSTIGHVRATFLLKTDYTTEILYEKIFAYGDNYNDPRGPIQDNLLPKIPRGTGYKAIMAGSIGRTPPSGFYSAEWQFILLIDLAGVVQQYSIPMAAY